MRTNGIAEKILAAAVLGINIFGVIYFLLRALENPEISAIYALVTSALFGLLYRLKLLERRKRQITRTPK